MRIAFIGQKGIPATIGGVEKHVEELATRLVEQGHQVFVYARNNYTDKNLKSYKGIKLIHLPSIPTKRLDAISHTFFSALHSLFQNYDIVHYHAIGPSSLLWISKILKPKTKVISTFHCQDYLHQKWGFAARLFLKIGEWISCKLPDKTIVVSKSLGEYARKKYKIDPVLISNGANVEIKIAEDKLSEWQLKSKKYILSVSRLVKHKGIHYLIEAFKQLEDTNKLPNGFKLVIVGDGFHTDDYVDYLKTIARNRKNIIFTGAQTGEALAQLFSHAYLFVQPSETEGLSISLLEAMKYNLPIVASDIKENVEALEDAGIFFQSKNVADLHKKMAYILNKPEIILGLTEKAAKRAEKEYSWNSSVKKLTELYAELISQKSL